MSTSDSSCWFLTGSQGLYGPETLEQVERQSRSIADELNATGLPVEVIWKPVLTSSEAVHQLILAANADPGCIGLIAWMHTFSPAKMWIAGLDALQTPLLHLHTQANLSLPWSEIDMDFMNLNQAAHGDREFGYIQTRLGVARKTVAGHVSNPRTVARIAAWQRAAIGHAAVRRLKLARFGDNMRDVAVTEGDKVEAQLRFGVSVNTWGVNDLVKVVDEVGDAEIDALIEEYSDSFDVAPELASGGDRHESLRYGARIEAGLRAFLTDGGFGAFTTNFQDLGGLRQLPGLAVQRLMAEGYGFGGEGTGKPPSCCTPSRRWRSSIPAAPPSWRTTPITGDPGFRRSSAPTCSRSARRSPRAGRGSRSTRSASEIAKIPCGWSSTPSLVRRWWSGSAISATASGSS